MTQAVSTLSPDADLVARAQAGDRGAFDALVRPELPRLERLVRRLVGHPEHTRDLVQDALVRAFEGIGKFDGRSRFGTWLYTIASRQALDFHRGRKTWRPDAQVHGHIFCMSSEEEMERVAGALQGPDFRYEAREHIAYCFTCVSRSLEPEVQLALVLKDVLDLKNREAAQAAGVTESVLRARVAQARQQMTERFEGLCALVNKDGVCWQCEGLREHARDQGESSVGLLPEGEPTEASYRRRLRIVQEADVHEGRSQALHDILFRQLFDLEECRTSDAAATDYGGCRRPSP